MSKPTGPRRCTGLGQFSPKSPHYRDDVRSMPSKPLLFNMLIVLSCSDLTAQCACMCAILRCYSNHPSAEIGTLPTIPFATDTTCEGAAMLKRCSVSGYLSTQTRRATSLQVDTNIYFALSIFPLQSATQQPLFPAGCHLRCIKCPCVHVCSRVDTNHIFSPFHICSAFHS